MRRIVYIAGPISGEDVFESLRNINRFTECENALLRKGFAPINPASDAAAVGLGGVSRQDCMQKANALVASADVVYLLRGWRYSNGACAEMGWAVALGVPIAYEPEGGFSMFYEIDKALYEWHKEDFSCR